MGEYPRHRAYRGSSGPRRRLPRFVRVLLVLLLCAALTLGGTAVYLPGDRVSSPTGGQLVLPGRTALTQSMTTRPLTCPPWCRRLRGTPAHPAQKNNVLAKRSGLIFSVPLIYLRTFSVDNTFQTRKTAKSAIGMCSRSTCKFILLFLQILFLQSCLRSTGAQAASLCASCTPPLFRPLPRSVGAGCFCLYLGNQSAFSSSQYSPTEYIIALSQCF